METSRSQRSSGAALVIMGVVLAALSPGRATALLVTWEFSGSVARSTSSEVAVGDELAGEITFDPDTGEWDERVSGWRGFELTGRVTVADTTVNLDNAGTLVQLASGGDFIDNIGFSLSVPSEDVDPPLGERRVVGFSLTLIGPFFDLAPDQIPRSLPPIDLAGDPTRIDQARTHGSILPGPGIIYAPLTSITQVPEPALPLGLLVTCGVAILRPARAGSRE